MYRVRTRREGVNPDLDLPTGASNGTDADTDLASRDRVDRKIARDGWGTSVRVILLRAISPPPVGARRRRWRWAWAGVVLAILWRHSQMAPELMARLAQAVGMGG